jgi:SAM-dependent methyltransferase
MTQPSYLLANNEGELERLRLQARVLEPEAEAMLDRIGVQAGWSCIDLGCGAMGILGPLSKRAGPHGRVVGADQDAKQLAAARDYVRSGNLTNVEIIERDAYDTGIERESFDFVHVRFVFAPVGRDQALLQEILRLVKPGGTVAIQEPDSRAWNCFPPNTEWTKLKNLIVEAFKRGGGDVDAGQRTFGMLRCAGLEDVQVRAAALALYDRHPYMRLPVQFAGSLRQRILDSDIVNAPELDALIAECERVAGDPDTFITNFNLVQAWGRKPAR